MTKKNEEKTKEVAVKNDFAVSSEFAEQFDSSLQSAGDTMDADDFRIPKLTLIQQMTKASFNTEGVEVGRYINSIEKMDMGDTLDMFVMTDIKLWQFDYLVHQGANKPPKKEYLTITDFAPFPGLRKDWTEEALPEQVKQKMDAKGIKFEDMVAPDLIYRFYVLLAEEVKEGLAFPYIIDFKRSSAETGNKLKNTFFKMKKLAKVPSYSKVFTMTSEFVQDEFDYYVKKVNGGRNIETEELVAVENWIKELSANAGKYEVDESDTAADNTIVDAEVVEPTAEGKPKF